MTAAPDPSHVGAALAAQGLVRSYGHVPALRGVSFALTAGSVLSVFGPNGAGKTTLLRLLAGLLRPDAGEVLVGGNRFVRGDAAIRRRIGLISHLSLCYEGLTARENLEFYARLYRLRDPRGAARLALESVGLADRATSMAGAMSRGMLQRLAIARALLHQPDIVLLDEPFTGLDQQAAAGLRGQLGRLVAEEKRTLVMVTHNLEEGLELATDVAILVAGRFAACAPRGDAAAWRARYAEATRG